MPSSSEKQKKFFGVVMAAKYGQKGVSGAAKKAAKGMTKKQIKKMLKVESFESLFADAMITEMHGIDTLKHPLKDKFIDMMTEYIKEGEHQDGESFWDNFSSVKDILDDMNVYFSETINFRKSNRFGTEKDLPQDLGHKLPGDVYGTKMRSRSKEFRPSAPMGD